MSSLVFFPLLIFFVVVVVMEVVVGAAEVVEMSGGQLHAFFLILELTSG